jgi:hypothetical protein
VTVRGPTGVYWGDLPGLAEGFELARTVGWEPAVAKMRVTRGDVLSWLLKHDPKRFDKLGQTPLLPAIADALTEAAPRRFTPTPTLKYRGHLVVLEQRADGSRLSLRPKTDFFLTEARVVDREAEPALIELVFADVRKFWRDYGEVTIEANVPRGRADDGSLLYVRRTVKNGVTPWLISELLRKALAQLPGAPELVGHVPHDRACRELRSVGGSALEVSQALVEEVRGVFNYHLSGTCSVETPGIGIVGEAS